MAIRIDEYGHIIRDDTTTSVNATSSTQNSDVNLTNVSDDLSLIRVDSAQTNSQTSTPILETSIPWYGRGGVFWTVTIILSIAIALVMSIKVVPLVFGTMGGSSSNFADAIANFIFKTAPYTVFIGTLVGSIWYNIAATKKSHAAYEYILSPLCAVVGAAVTGLLVLLLAFAVYIVIRILCFGFVIAIIAGLVSGG